MNEDKVNQFDLELHMNDMCGTIKNILDCIKGTMTDVQRIESRISAIETRLDKISAKLDSIHRYPNWPDTNVF